MRTQNKIVGIIGRKGTGKSSALREILQHTPRFVLWDAMAEHAWCTRIPSIDALYGFLTLACDSGTAMARYVPQDDLEDDFGEVCEAVYETGRIALAVEEVPFLVSPSTVPGAFDRIIRTGRHKGIDVFWTAQRAAEVARRLTAATDLFFLFSQTEPRDLDALAERIGSESAREVAGLPRHGFLIWDVLDHCAISPEVAARKISEPFNVNSGRL
ncbi:MAG: hypothetical protein ACRD4Q_14500 [Candidatus Acidiferrales bacterium]